MTKLTGEQLTEKFFTEVMKYYPKEITGHGIRWFSRNLGYEEQVLNELPPLHNSLDLQEVWLWPELRKKRFSESLIISREKDFKCYIIPHAFIQDIYLNKTNAQGETKALAQLEATLKALGVL